MKKVKLLLFSVDIEIILIICITLANHNPTLVLYFIFYILMYGLIFSFLIPLYYLRKERELLTSVGIKKRGIQQFIVLVCFVAFSVGGQLIPQIVMGEQIPWY